MSEKRITLTGSWQSHEPGSVLYVLDSREDYRGRFPSVDRGRAERLVDIGAAVWGKTEIETPTEPVVEPVVEAAAEPEPKPKRRRRRRSTTTKKE